MQRKSSSIDHAHLAPLDTNQRYEIPEACNYLRVSRAKVYQQIRAGEIRVIKSGRRVHIPGAEIARLSR